MERSEFSRVALRKQRTRAAILQAAETLFSQRGYDAATMQEIATLAEVGLGTMYGYFPSKDDVLRTILQGKAQAVSAHARQELESSHNAVERAAIILRHTWLFLSENRQMALALIALDINNQERGLSEQTEAYRALVTILRLGVARGEIASVPLETTAMSLLSVYTWAALQLGFWRQERDPTAVLSDLEQMTRRMLVPAPWPPGSAPATSGR